MKTIPRFILAMVLVAVTAAAEPVKVGDELRIGGAAGGEKRRPSVTMAADGGFVVVWSVYPKDASGGPWDVRGRSFDALGKPKGDEFQLRSYTAEQGRVPAVAQVPGGGFVVVWHEAEEDRSGTPVWNVRGRRTTAGWKTLEEIDVDSSDVRLAWPAVSVGEDGSMVVAWQGWGEAGDGEAWGIRAQRFDTDGALLGGRFQVNTSTASYQRYPGVAVGADGSFLVVWESDGSTGDDASSTSVQGQLFDRAGRPRGGETQWNVLTPSAQRMPAAAALAEGGWVVTWESSAPPSSIRARLLDAAGESPGAEFQVSSETGGAKHYPAVASAPGGRFVVVWDTDAGGSYGVRAQRFVVPPKKPKTDRPRQE